ncbi:MAG: alpha-amylase family glycosyl hydrolase [Flavobacteriaceae bacterium]|nr:alpha-amylase family glycosyl hydrolase [Flavobacteriaceae bacterium]
MSKTVFFLSTIFMMLQFTSCKKEESTTNSSNGTTSTTQTVQNTVQQPDWAKNAVIYEVNIRQFSPEGNFAGVTSQLQRIKDLGADIIWLMPIHPIGELNRKGSLGSYYAVKDYKAVNPAYGSLEDFDTLVKTAHDLGLKVILDWVANHSSPDNVWVKDHLDYYTKDSLGNAPIPTVGTDWLDVADLNYDNHDMRAAMQDAMLYWVKEHHIDGFRCDVAEMVPMDFWLDTRKKLDEVKDVFMLAEGAAPELHQAFNMTYGWPLKDAMISIVDNKSGFEPIQKYLEERNKQYQSNDLIMYFTSNHDENSWNYLEEEKFGKNRMNYAALTYFMGGMPLIYSGQESGLERKLEFFEKDPITWGNFRFQKEYINLIRAYKENQILWNNGERANYDFIKTDKDALYFTLSKNGKKAAVLQNHSSVPQYIPVADWQEFDLNKNALGNTANNIGEKGMEIPPHTTILLLEK